MKTTDTNTAHTKVREIHRVHPHAVTIEIGNESERMQKANQLIAQRAFELWRGRGGLDGYAVQDWLQAEAEILQSMAAGFIDCPETVTVTTGISEFESKEVVVCVEPRRLVVSGAKTDLSEPLGLGPELIFRMLELPCGVDASHVTAKLTGGVLEIQMRKEVVAMPATPHLLAA